MWNCRRCQWQYARGRRAQPVLHTRTSAFAPCPAQRTCRCLLQSRHQFAPKAERQAGWLGSWCCTHRCRPWRWQPRHAQDPRPCHPRAPFPATHLPSTHTPPTHTHLVDRGPAAFTCRHEAVVHPGGAAVHGQLGVAVKGHLKEGPRGGGGRGSKGSQKGGGEGPVCAQQQGPHTTHRGD